MRHGYTITVETLTYAGTVPDAYDYLAEEVEDGPRFVVRRYDTIVHTRPCWKDPDSAEREQFIRELAAQQWPITDHDGPDWHEWELYAETLHAHLVTAPEQTLLLPYVATGVDT